MEKTDWDLVSDAFENECENCASCEHLFYQYWTDTGAETSCMLLDGDKGSPGDCPAFAGLKDKLLWSQ